MASFVVVQIRCRDKDIKRWYGTNFLPGENFFELYSRLASGQIDFKPVEDKYNECSISVYVSPTASQVTKILVDSSLSIVVLPSIGKFVEFLITPIDDTPVLSVKASAFDIMMSSSKLHIVPEKCDPINKKAELKNDIIDWLSKNKVGWSGGSVRTSGVSFLNDLTKVPWSIDGYHEQLAQRSHGLPPELQHFKGYNCPEKSNHKKRPHSLDASQLREHSCILLGLTELPYMKSSHWRSTKAVLLRLAIHLRDHATYLEKQSESCSKRRSEIRDFAFGSNDAFTAIEPTISWNPTEVARYKSLNDALEHTPSYEVIDLNGFVPMEPWRKYKYMKGLKVRYRCIRYTHVSGKTTLNFVWRVPVYDEKTEVLNKSSELKDSILKEIPNHLAVYATLKATYSEKRTRING